MRGGLPCWVVKRFWRNIKKEKKKKKAGIFMCCDLLGKKKKVVGKRVAQSWLRASRQESRSDAGARPRGAYFSGTKEEGRSEADSQGCQVVGKRGRGR